MAGVDLGSIVAHLKLEMNDFNNNLNKAKDQINSTEQNFRGLKSTGEAFTKVGGALTAGVTVPVMGIAASVVNTQMKFQDAMAKVQALSGASGAELKKLEDTAKQMGATTIFSASECADALGYMALAGWDANESAAGLPGVLNLAAASGMELAEASDMVTDYLTAFGLEADQAGRMADVLSYAQAHSNTTTQQLGEAFKNCAVNAHNAGMSLEETTAILGKLADQGLKGSEAGTALNAVIRDMTQKMKDGHIQIGNTKVAVQDANGNFRKMSDIVADVTKATEGMGDAEKTAALQSTFTADSIKAMGILCNTGADDIDKFTKSLENSKGSAQKMSDMMNNTLSGSLKQLGSAWEALQLSLGDTTGPLSLLIGMFTKFLQALNKLPGPVKQFIVTLGLIVAAVGPVLLIVGKMITTYLELKKNLGLLKGAFAVFNGGLSSLLTGALTKIGGFITGSVMPALSSLWGVLMANPIILVIAAIAALVAGFIYLWNNCEGFRQFWIDLWNEIKNVCQPAIDAIKQAFENLMPQLQGIWHGIVEFFTGIGNILKGIFSGDWDQIKQGLIQCWDGIKTAAIAAWSLICEGIKMAIQGIGDWIAGIWESIKTWCSTAWDNIKTTVTEKVSSMIDTIVNFFTNLPSTIWYWLCFVIAYVVLWAGQMIQKGIEAGSKFVQGVIQWFIQLPSKIKVYFSLALTYARKWLHDMVTKAREMGSKFVQNVINWIKQLPSKVSTWLTNTISKVTTWASNMKSKAQQAGSQFLQRVIQFIQQLPGRVWSFLSRTIQKAISFATQFAQKGMQAARNFASKIKSGLANLPGQMVSIGKRIIQGIVNGVTSGARNLYNAMRNIASKALNAAKEKLGIHSPSRVFANEVGQWIPKGVTVGIEANAGNTLKAIRDYANSLVEEIDTNKFLGEVNMATSGININTDNSNSNGNLVAALKQYTQAIIDNKQDIDYDRMGVVMGNAVAQQSNPIIMDKTIVGQKVASSVRRTNNYYDDQQSRFRGDKDYV